MIGFSTFPKATARLRNSVYGVMGLSQVGPKAVNATNGTASMISPGILATAAHFVHVENDVTKPVHQRIEAIRAPDVGQQVEQATLIAEDLVRDLALLRLGNPRSSASVKLAADVVPIGTTCGSLGFPLATVQFTPQGRSFNLTERFQGASISAYLTVTHKSGRRLPIYETDALMYAGSSGCPGYLINGRIWGMHVSSVVDPQSQAPGKQSRTLTDRLSISIWVPAGDIASFAQSNAISM